MSDLVERLRKMAATHERGFPVTILYSEICQALDIEASDRITALEKENAELRTDCQRKDELLTAAVDDYNDARSLALEEAACIAYRTCAETRHVTLGDKAATAIRRIKPSEAEGREG